jgi:metal-sulfur cluster biosynthetic enzyme
VRTIRDPELPRTLEELEVVLLDDVRLWQRGGLRGARVRFFPTVPHCHLAPTIGLCIRAKLARSLPPDVKLDLAVVPGSHATAADVTKQINDKDRAAAALDDPRIRVLVHRCIGDLGAHG